VDVAVTVAVGVGVQRTLPNLISFGGYGGARYPVGGIVISPDSTPVVLT
jgi:hypothetical protein